MLITLKAFLENWSDWLYIMNEQINGFMPYYTAWLLGVAVSRGYDTCFEKGLVMGYGDC